jgi:ferredoxin
MDAKFRIAIVGAGPVALAAGMYLRSAGFGFEFIDPGIFSKSRGATKDSNIDFRKSRFGETDMYDYPAQYLESTKNSKGLTSLVVGGFSTVWGGGLEWRTSVIQEAEPLIKLEDIDFVKSIFGKFNSAPVTNSLLPSLIRNEVQASNYLQASSISVDASNCILCGSCMKGCPENLIWSSENQFRALIDEGITLRPYFVETISENSNSISIKCIKQKDQTIVNLQYDYVFVAAGAIASMAIAQRSNLAPKVVQIRETRIVYVPMVLTRKNHNSSPQFTLSEVFYDSRSMLGNSGIWMSLFESSPEIKFRVQKYLGKVAAFIPKLVWKQLAVGITYVPAENSNVIKLERVSSIKTQVTISPEKPKNRSYWRKSLKLAMKDLRKLGIIGSTKILLFGAPGSSYHFGSARTESGQYLLDDWGRLSQSKVQFIDGSQLRRLPQGPITTLAMMNSVRIIRQTLVEPVLLMSKG